MQSVFLRVAALAWAGLSLLLALHWFVELGMVGFPDGYVTPFARATGPLLTSSPQPAWHKACIFCARVS
jgi:hypothetical protein